LNLRDVKIHSFVARNVALEADLRGAEIVDFSFRGVFLLSKVDEKTIMRRGALLETDIGIGDEGMPVFDEVNISGSTVYNLAKARPPLAGQIGLWFWADWPPYKLLTNVAEEDLAAAGVTICRPPQDGGGVALAQRPITPHLPNGQPGCVRMTLAEAKAAYRRAYLD
jgi:hypothetical protein